MNIEKPKQKICPSCGKTFTCHDNEDCWCERARIHKKDLMVILSRFNDCICPDCLHQFEE